MVFSVYEIDPWMDGWMDAKAILRIAYSNQKCFFEHKLTFEFVLQVTVIDHLKLEVWPGYVTHVEEKEGGLMLTCDVSHRVLRAETAYDVLQVLLL